MNICEAMKKATDGYCTVRLTDLENDVFTALCAGERDQIVPALRKECGEIVYPGTITGLYTISDLTAEDWIIMPIEELWAGAGKGRGASASISESVADKPVLEAVSQFCNAAKAAGFEMKTTVIYANNLPSDIQITAKA